MLTTKPANMPGMVLAMMISVPLMGETSNWSKVPISRSRAIDREVTTRHIYRGIVPFVLIQVLGLALLWFFPWVVTIVPDLIPSG